MIPIRDENPVESAPVVTRGLIALNVAVFLYELLRGPELGAFIGRWAMIPERMTLAISSGQEPITAPALTFLTSMFLHGGWMHLIGNMWYLWIFGDNVEDRLGKVRFLVFYLLSGLVASGVEYAFHPDSQAPTLGASGAIAGVLGAYALLFPGARVLTLMPFFQVWALPALLVLGLWFVLQFFSGWLSLAASLSGGIAWWAHIAGFAFGLLTVKLFERRRHPASHAWVES